MIDPATDRVLITGAAGAVGTALRVDRRPSGPRKHDALGEGRRASRRRRRHPLDQRPDEVPNQRAGRALHTAIFFFRSAVVSSSFIPIYPFPA
jgi:hypothetical protein